MNYRALQEASARLEERERQRIAQLANERDPRNEKPTDVEIVTAHLLLDEV